MLAADDIHGLYAITPTPALASTDWTSRTTLDEPEMRRLVDALITDGASGIIALGTTGECATLPSEEYQETVTAITSAADRRRPVFIGSTALSLVDVLRRLQTLRDAGADGTLLGLPMWQPMTEDDAVRFYATVSAEFPDLAVMVYANERAFRFPFARSPAFWERLTREAPTAVAAKFSNVDAFPMLQDATEGKIHFLPNDMKAARFAAVRNGGFDACWATSASMGPLPALQLLDALASGDATRASQISADIAWTNEPVDELFRDPIVFASYNIQIEKTRIAAAGYCRPGPMRPPYTAMPAEYTTRAIECGHRWAQLCERYRTAVPASQAR